MAVGSKIACTAQARDRDRIEQTVVRPEIEQAARRNEIARSGRQAGKVEFGVPDAIDMASAATHAGLPRGAAEDRRRAEGHIAQIDQIGFAAAESLRAEDLARSVEGILVQFGPDGQHRLVAVDWECPDRCCHKRKPADQRCRPYHRCTRSWSEGRSSSMPGAAVWKATISSSVSGLTSIS